MNGKGYMNRQKEKVMPKVAKRSYFRPLVLLSILVLLTFLAYLRSIHAPLIFDDFIYIRPLKLKGILNHFSLHVRSIAVFSFGLNYYLLGMNLVAFRITNIIFHILSTFFAAYFTYTTLILPSMRDRYERFAEGKTPLYIALLVATLFLLHPIQTSAVNYITQRMAIMASMFSFAGFIFYVKGAAKRGRMAVLYYVLSSLSFILAIFSKENAVMVLFMLPVYDFFFLSTFQWKEFRKRFITVSVLLLSLALIVAYKMGAVGFIGKIFTLLSNPNQPMERLGYSGMGINWTPGEYLLTELRIVSRYIFLILVPAPSFMVFDYSNAYPVSKDLLNPLTTLFSLVFLISALFFSLKYSKRAPLISFGILWYLTTISLESFIALGLDPYFEHRNYLPSFGLFLGLATLLPYEDRLKLRVKKETIIILVALPLFALTFIRNGVWREGRLLWEEAVEKAPNNVRARVNLGAAYVDQGLIDKAFEQYRTVLKMQPDNPNAHLNLGEVFFKKGLVDKAIEEYEKALGSPQQVQARHKSDPLLERTNSDVHYNLGTAFQKKGLTDKAIEQYQTALRIRSDFAEPYINLGIIYGELGTMDKAMEYFQAAVQLDPDFAKAHYNLGTALHKKRLVEAAVEQYRIALKLDPGYAEAHSSLGSAYRDLGWIDKAIEHFQTAIKLRPDFANAHANLGAVFFEKGLIDKAIEEDETALKLQPDLVETYKELGNAFYKKGLTDKAIEQYQIALKLRPDLIEARKKLGNAFYKKGLIDKAIEQYQIALKLQPGSGEIHYNLGVAFYDKKLMNKAIEQYQIALKLKPGFAQAHNNLGSAYVELGSIDKAIEHFQTAEKLDPSNPVFRDNLARANALRNQK